MQSWIYRRPFFDYYRPSPRLLPSLRYQPLFGGSFAACRSQAGALALAGPNVLERDADFTKILPPVVTAANPASDSSAAREIATLKSVLAGFAFDRVAARSEWNVLLATPLIQSANGLDETTAREIGPAQARVAGQASERAAGEENAASRLAVAAYGRDEPRERSSGASRGALLARGLSEPKACERGLIVSTAGRIGLSEAADRDRGVTLVDAAAIASDASAGRDQANEKVTAALAAESCAAAEELASYLILAELVALDCTAGDSSALALMDAQAIGFSRAVDRDSVLPAGIAFSLGADQSAGRDSTNSLSSVGLVGLAEETDWSLGSVLALTQIIAADEPRAFTAGNERVTASLFARDRTACETWLVAIWTSGIDWDAVAGWSFVAFAGAIGHAAFDSPTHVAFGSLADPSTSNKGHVAFGDLS